MEALQYSVPPSGLQDKPRMPPLFGNASGRVAMLTAARRDGVALEEPELFAASLYAGRARMAGAGPSSDTSTKETDL